MEISFKLFVLSSAFSTVCTCDIYYYYYYIYVCSYYFLIIIYVLYDSAK